MQKAVISLLALVANMPAAGQSRIKPEPAPQAYYLETSIDAGHIPEGPSHVFTFRVVNHGKAPLLLMHVNSSCGCLSSDWSKEPVMPGDTAIILGHYNTRGRRGPFTKSLWVQTNEDSGGERAALEVKGVVVPLLSGDDVLEFSGPLEQDAGDVVHGTPAHFSFRFTNKGAAAIRLQPTTPPDPRDEYTLALPKRLIAPGATAVIQVEYANGRGQNPIYSTGGGGQDFYHALWITVLPKGREKEFVELRVKGTMRYAKPPVPPNPKEAK